MQNGTAVSFGPYTFHRQQRLVKIDDETHDLMTVDGARIARFTSSRDTATSGDNVELMGLDHPLIQEELGRWRNVLPEDIGIAVSGDVDAPVLLSLWMVEVSEGNSERRVTIQSIAVKQDGTRVPVVELLADKFLQAPTTLPNLEPEQRQELFAKVVEPVVQREIKHKYSMNENSSYSIELIGYIEIVCV